MFWNLPSFAGDAGSIPGWGPKIPHVCVCVCVYVCVCVCVCEVDSVVSDSAILWTIDHQDPLSVGFSRQEYYSGLLCPPPGDLPDPGKESLSPMSPLLLAPPGKPQDPTYLRATKPGLH